MTLKEFEAYLSANEDKAKKFEELKESIAVENEEELFAAFSKAAAEVGCDVSPAEFAMDEIANNPVDDEEMAKVGGGRNWCWFDYTCHGIIKHPDEQDKNSACLADYQCATIYHDSELQKRKKDGNNGGCPLMLRRVPHPQSSEE